MTLIMTLEQLREVLRQELPNAIENHARKPNPEKLYTRAQVARILGKDKSTIQRMIDQNRIQSTADGKYISQQSISDYLTGQPRAVTLSVVEGQKSHQSQLSHS